MGKTAPFVLLSKLTDAVEAMSAVAAFPPILKFATGVVEVTNSGAVPVATVEIIEPYVDNVLPDTAPVATTEAGVIAPRVKVMVGVVVAVATDPLTPLAVTTDVVVTVPLLPAAVNVPPLKVRPLPTVITSGFPVAAVLLPNNELVEICCIFPTVTAFGVMVVAFPTEVTSPVELALVVTVAAVVAVVAFPVKAPVNPVELTDVKPVNVAGKDNVTVPVLEEALI